MQHLKNSTKRSHKKRGSSSGINIKKSHSGKFTAWAKAHGFKSVAAAASAVMANKSKYSAAVVKMANFAKNAKHFKH